MTIGFVTSANPLDKKAWSGTHYSLYKAVENRGFNIIALTMSYTKNQVRLIKYLGKLHSFLFFKKKYNPYHNHFRAYFAARYYEKILQKQKVDVIFAPVSAPEIALLKTDIPIIYLSDSSFNQIIEYYSYSFWTNLSKLSIKESNVIEKKALHNSAYIIYSSSWAADYATRFYELDPNRVKLISFGANIDTPKDINHNKDYTGEITFLFLGVDWKRKGGDIAFNTIETLHKKGYNVKLLVCGCVPPVKSELIECIPFLDKNKAEDNSKLQSLLLNSHFLFVPTRADCTPIVFCEAAGFGLPIITTDTGGVSSIITNGVNGYALPFDAPVLDYVSIIETLLDSPDKIVKICKQAREKYDKEFNWNTFGEKFEGLVRSLLNRS